MSARAASRLAVALLAATLAGALLGALVLPRGAAAQQPPSIGVSAVFDPPTAAIGDRVTLNVRVTHPDDVILKAEPPKLDQVDLVTTVPSVTVDMAPGTQVTTFDFTLQPFVLGTLDAAPVRLSWLRADGTTGTFEAPGARLEITPVRTQVDTELRPLKPQASIAGGPPAWLRPALTAGVVLALLLVTGGVALLLRRRAVPETVEAPPADRSPERVARDALDALHGLGPRGSGDYAAYYGGIALTVRTYLAARFGFNAHALTTTELEQRMVSHGVDRWQARLVGGLLERCDDAVYAHRYPEADSADHDLTVAYEIVELSRPRPVSLEGEAVPA